MTKLNLPIPNLPLRLTVETFRASQMEPKDLDFLSLDWIFVSSLSLTWWPVRISRDLSTFLEGTGSVFSWYPLCLEGARNVFWEYPQGIWKVHVVYLECSRSVFRAHQQLFGVVRAMCFKGTRSMSEVKNQGEENCSDEICPETGEIDELNGFRWIYRWHHS